MEKIKTPDGIIYKIEPDERLKLKKHHWTAQDVLDNCWPNGSISYKGEHFDCLSFGEMTHLMWLKAKKPITLKRSEVSSRYMAPSAKRWIKENGYTIPAGAIVNYIMGPVEDYISVITEDNEGNKIGYEIFYGGMDAWKDILRAGSWEEIDVDVVKPWEVPGFHGAKEFYRSAREFDESHQGKGSGRMKSLSEYLKESCR